MCLVPKQLKQDAIIDEALCFGLGPCALTDTIATIDCYHLWQIRRNAAACSPLPWPSLCTPNPRHCCRITHCLAWSSPPWFLGGAPAWGDQRSPSKPRGGGGDDGGRFPNRAPVTRAMAADASAPRPSFPASLRGFLSSTSVQRQWASKQPATSTPCGRWWRALSALSFSSPPVPWRWWCSALEWKDCSSAVRRGRPAARGVPPPSSIPILLSRRGRLAANRGWAADGNASPPPTTPVSPSPLPLPPKRGRPARACRPC